MNAITPWDTDRTILYKILSKLDTKLPTFNASKDFFAKRRIKNVKSSAVS